VKTHAQPRFLGEPRGLGVELVADREWCVGRDADAHQLSLLLEEHRDARAKNRHRAVALLGRGTERLLEHDSANAHLQHRVHHQTSRARIGVSGDSSVETFDDSVSRRVEEHLFGERFLPAAPQLVYPVVEAEILEKSAHRGELEMGMRVDDPRKQHALAEVVILAGRRGVNWSDVLNHAAIFHDATVLDRRARHRNDPPREVALHRGRGCSGLSMRLVSVLGGTALGRGRAAVSKTVRGTGDAPGATRT